MRFQRPTRPGRPTRSKITSTGDGGGGGGSPTGLLAGTTGLGLTTLTLSANAGTATGDVLIAFTFGGTDIGGLTNSPTGWTKLEDETYSTSAWTEIWWRTAAANGSDAANDFAAEATGANRIVGAIMTVSGGGTIDTSGLGYTNKSGWQVSGTNARIFSPLPVHNEGILVVAAGCVFTGAQQGVSVYDRGTELINYYTSGGVNYDFTAGGGTTDGSADAAFAVTNMYGTLTTWSGWVSVS